MAPLAPLLAVVALALAAPGEALGHAGLVGSEPAAGANLGAAPSAIVLTFTEEPEAALSEIRVMATGGGAVTAGVASADGMKLQLPVSGMATGVYTVSYRVTSAVDGHASTGAFAFGVGADPQAAQAEAAEAGSRTSGIEVGGRSLLLAGLVLLVGAATARLARFGDDLQLGVAGWLLAALGLGLLAEAQRSSAGVSFGDLLDTAVGEALVERAIGLAIAGAALVVALATGSRAFAGVAGAGALATVVFHVATGHAAAGSWPSGLTVAAQSAHIAAAGVWVGGLATLLLGPLGAPAVRRFAGASAAALALVLVTGTLRAVDELTVVDDLWATGYGRAVLAKVLLFAAVLVLVWRNRRGTPRLVELAPAVGALVAAALLGSLAPPVAGAREPRAALSATGQAGGVRVELSTASAEPGPNTFTLRVEGTEDESEEVRLRFTPLDDPGDGPTTLSLPRTGDGEYAGPGENLVYDGRWGIEATVGAVAVPLEIDVPGEDTFPTIQRSPGEKTYMYKPVSNLGFVQITFDPERAGASRMTATAYDLITSEHPVTGMVLTMQAGGGEVRQLSMRRVSRGTYATDIELPEGEARFAVIAHTRDGLRLRGTFDVRLSAGS